MSASSWTRSSPRSERQPPRRRRSSPARAPGPPFDNGLMNQLIRPRQGRLIAGVCAAVADRFGWDRTLVRVLTVAAVIFAGLSLWIYILLWIIIPSDG